MTNNSRRDVLAGMGAGFAVLTLDPLPGLAAGWGKRPITLVIQYSEGGGTDTIIRSLGQALEKQLGVNIRAVNQPGAVGSVATQFVKSKPASGQWMLGGAEYNKFFRVLGYGDDAPWRTWQFLKVGTSIPAWGVAPNSRFKSLADVIEAAKAQPGKIKISNAGIGSIWHEATLVALERGTGAKFTHVPYKGGAPATLAVLQGEADVVASGVHEQIEYIRSGKVRNLAVFKDKPLAVPGVTEPLTPVSKDVPSAVELGLLHGVYAVGLKRDTDPEIVRKVHDAVKKAVDDPAFVKVLQGRVMFPEFKGGAEADREAALFESITSWLFWDQKMASVKRNPADLGIPRPGDFAAWWPPKDYKPVL
ncbi:MAG: tripartite tricarboxylate transporter substrate binding protein [Hyphomicrobiales bacterium]|nr:tripartite tricarboxylate transporter substrate binding protein [Hyphomicrobiales bacterium]